MWAMAQNGNKLVDIQNGGPDLFDEVNEAKMLHEEDKRAFAARRWEFGRHGNVQDKIRFFEGEQKKERF